MNPSVYAYYSKTNDDNDKSFSEVILIDQSSALSWEEIEEKVGNCPKGWFELAHLPITDRKVFIQEFWKSVLPYVPHIDSFLNTFFLQVDDVALFLTKKKNEDLFNSELVYSMKGGKTFFRGSPPAEEKEIRYCNRQFQNLLPKDFLSFMHIHNGFAKASDSGIIPVELIIAASSHIKEEILALDKSITCNNKPIDPNAIIPFYQCYGRNVFQCFYLDWYPTTEMGNVNYSGIDHTISDYHSLMHLSENLAFLTFLDWLSFYLEDIEVV